MKRVLGIVLALVSMGFVGSAKANTADVTLQNSTVASAVPQWQRDRYGRRYDRRYDRRYGRRNDRRYDRRYNRFNRRQRTVSRVVRYGRGLYRETYLVTYWPSGQYNTRLISRTRIG
jgi:hypothetical protein